MPELRKDPVTGRQVIISPERALRPSAFRLVPERRQEMFCPFCPGQENQTPLEILAYRQPETPAIPNTPGWKLRVVPNRFPALRSEGEVTRKSDGLFHRMEGIGVHEVIIESPDHSRQFSEFTAPEIEMVFRAYRDRCRDLKKDGRFRYILLFKNEGALAGATLEHPHSQLIALPHIPGLVQEELAGSREHYLRKKRCIFCDLLRQELESRVRVVAENAEFAALSPYAPRFPYELWILPRRHNAALDRSEADEMLSLASILRECLQRLGRALDKPPYNLFVHTAPLDEERSAHYHWHLEITPSLSRIAGFELATGCYINPVSPEDATRELKQVDLAEMPKETDFRMNYRKKTGVRIRGKAGT